MLKRKNKLICLTFSVLSTMPSIGYADICKFALPTDISLSKFSFSIGRLPVLNFGNTDTPLALITPPVIMCPTPIGVPRPCMTSTIWEPDQLLESKSQPMQILSACVKLPLLSGMLSTNKSESNNTNSQQQTTVKYPVFSMLNLFKGRQCSSADGFGVTGLSELNPFKQIDFMAHLQAPWGLLMSIPLVQPTSDFVQATTTKVVRFSNSLLFGSCEGPIFPFSVHSNHQNNNIVGSENDNNTCKHREEQSASFEKFQKIGPVATCYNHPNPITVKEGDDIQPQGPITARGIRSGIGGLKFDFPPVINFPTGEGTVNFLWTEKQCCLM